MADLPKPTARTVGELKAALAKLPDSLPIESGFNNAVKLTVYNHSEPDRHLEIEESDEDAT